jgi:hypothetical protein
VPKYHWTKSEIWCQLGLVFTLDCLHDWQNVSVNTKPVSAHRQKINVEQIFNNIGLKGHQIISLPGVPKCLSLALLTKYAIAKFCTYSILKIFIV